MKKYSILLAIPFLLLSFGSFAQKADSTSSKLLGQMIGKWQIQYTSRAGRDRSANNQTQYIKFRLDAKYSWTNGNTLLDSGTFNTNEPMSEIYLQSNRDKDHLQEWKIDMKNKNTMSMTAAKGSRAVGTKYDLVRVKDGI